VKSVTLSNGYVVSVINCGTFRLDGGAMFGITPKPIWEKIKVPDKENRILLGCNPLLIETGSENILIDSGCGEKWNEKYKKIYAVDNDGMLEKSLKTHSIGFKDIDYVINTHLHFDHCGGNTRYVNGNLELTFVNAAYVLNKEEMQIAVTTNEQSPWYVERTRASYYENNVMPLYNLARTVSTRGISKILGDIKVRQTGGHTQGHQIVSVNDELIYLGDIAPFPAQLENPAHVMGYDTDPMTTFYQKKKVIKEALDKELYLAFEHDLEIGIGKLRENNKGNLYVEKILGV